MACADRTNETRDRLLRRIKDPSTGNSARYQRVPKAPGSKKLVMGKWITVLDTDIDAIIPDPKQKKP